MTYRRRMQGLSFVELMATLLIISVMVAIAIPGFNGLLQGNRAAAQSDLLLRALNYARGEAVRRNVEVRITSLSGDKNWGSQGWRIWVDKDADGAFTNADDELQTQSGLSGTSSLIAPDISELVFSGNGFLKKLAGYTFATQLTFNFRDSARCDLGRDITVTYAGRSIIERVGC